MGNNYIDPVSQDELDKAIECKTQDSSSSTLIEEEQGYIRRWREVRGEPENSAADTSNLVGLALSGGGIRSATFSLGIMQAFAAHDVLKKVDYLSTVSGGGYIGSSINWLTSKRAKDAITDKEGKKEKDFSTIKGTFPYGSDDPRPGKDQKDTRVQNRMLQYLREHGYYLTPGAGINIFSLFAAVLRGTFLNLLVWIPTFILIFLLLLLIPTLVFNDERSAPELVFNTLSNQFDPKLECPSLNTEEIGALKAQSACIISKKANTENKKEDENNILKRDIFKTAPISTTEVRQKIAARKPFEKFRERLNSLFVFELIMYLGLLIAVLLALSACLYSVVTIFSRSANRDTMYGLRRWSEKAVGIAIPTVIVCLLVGSLPLVGTYLHSWIAVSGPIAVLAGIIIAFRDFMLSAMSKKSTESSTLVSVGMGLFLYGVAVCSYLLAQWLFFDVLPSQLAYLLLLLAMVVILGWFVNINYISVHRFYRDRLMESFMPDIDDALKQRTGSAKGANSAGLHQISLETEPHGPYHIVNTNVVLVNSEQPTYNSRGGDSFILSPLYCGSNATGWRSTSEYMEGQMTLATAVAISGAAANPNTGVGGVGLTRNLFVSLTMSLLNLRLGYWAQHPNPKHWFDHSPNHFRPGAYALGNALGWRSGGYNEKRDFIQLSDGGHFENMGLYELIRRRVKLAIVCDGGADKEFSFSDMQTTVRRIEDDFGAHIEILEDASPDRVVPDSSSEPTYPPEADFAEQGHMLARIIYPGSDYVGWLIFMKTTFIKDVSFKVKGYKAQNPSFPDETTVDQFFDEVQFEAYRELGYCIADKMLNADMPEEIGEGILKELVANCEAYPSSATDQKTP